VCAAVAAWPGAAVAADAPAPCANADVLATPSNVTQTRAAIVCLLNAARAERGVPVLGVDVRLRSAAQAFARALDPDKPLTHAGGGGSTPLSRIAKAGYARGASGFTAAETLGRSHGDLATPATRVKAWLAAAGTRKLLLSSKYRDVGVGVMTRGDETTYVVESAAKLVKKPPTHGSA
jgi:uncharacterized protein YkwD